MIKIDGAYLYQFGSRMRAILNITEDTQPIYQVNMATADARRAILEFMLQSVFKQELFPVQQPADALLKELDRYDGDIFEMFSSEGQVSEWDIKSLKEKYRVFENVLHATFRISSMYYVSPKGGYNTQYLTDCGELIFPTELFEKVPEAVADIQQATRCIAFELPTAAGFHLHRANESVLRVYWDHVTEGQERPNEGNMGVYLRELNKLEKGKKSIREHLKSIKDFHRNPLMHPEQSLETVDEAISLLAAIRCSIGYMLTEIDLAPQALVLTPGPE